MMSCLRTLKSGWLFLMIVFIFSACQTIHKKHGKFNVLLMVVDDLRPELGCYGNKTIHSPHIDRLADRGLCFTSAFCNIPVCGASRASLMTGVRPAPARFVDYDTWADKDLPDPVCLPQHFKNNGYTTISNGKVFHHQGDRKESWDENWRPEMTTSWRDYQVPENILMDTSDRHRGPPYESAGVHDTAYFDGKIAEKSIRDLRRLKKEGKPFFLAVGFLKPHLPFNAPEKYWDLYEYKEISLPGNFIPDPSIPSKALHNSGELRAYSGIPASGPVQDTMARNLIRGYYACVSYTDSQVGRVLDALDELGLEESTIVLLFGDHGWNLGEHGLWCKHCNFYTSLRTTLIVRVPGVTNGESTHGLVEFIDIYPTVAELCRLELPGHLEGKSFVPLLTDPYGIGKEFVISKWFEGITINTKDYAYTEWRNEADSVYEQMLFDHRKDPGENNNLAGKEDLEKEVRRLGDLLAGGRGW